MTFELNSLNAKTHIQLQLENVTKYLMFQNTKQADSNTWLAHVKASRWNIPQLNQHQTQTQSILFTETLLNLTKFQTYFFRAIGWKVCDIQKPSWIFSKRHSTPKHKIPTTPERVWDDMEILLVRHEGKGKTVAHCLFLKLVK